MTPSTNLWYDGYIREDTHMDFNDAMTEAIELLEETARNADNAGEGHYAEHLNDIASALARKHWPDDYPTIVGHYRLSELTSDIDDITLEDAAAFAANAGMPKYECKGEFYSKLDSLVQAKRPDSNGMKQGFLALLAVLDEEEGDRDYSPIHLIDLLLDDMYDTKQIFDLVNSEVYGEAYIA